MATVSDGHHEPHPSDGEDRWKRAVQYTKVALSLAPDGPGSLVVQQIGTPPPPEKATSNWPDRETCQRVLNAVNEAWIAGKPSCLLDSSAASGKSHKPPYRASRLNGGTQTPSDSSGVAVMPKGQQRRSLAV